MSRAWLVIPLGIALGLVAEAGWRPNTDIRYLVADLATGWLLIGGGYVIWRSRPASRSGPFLMATGAAWFVGTLVPAAAFIYCGPLVHVLASHPTGRLRGRTSRAVVAAAYIVCAAAAVPMLAVGKVALGILIVAVGMARFIDSLQKADRPGATTYSLGTVVGLLLVRATAGAVTGSPDTGAGLIVYEAVLAATVLSMLAEVVWRAPSSAVLARIVVDLGDAAEAGTLRDRLARAVGDPSLTLGYATADQPNRWIDDAGRPVLRPPGATDRAVTPIVVGGREIGFVAHDPALAGDPQTFELIAAAAGLAISNSATQAEIRRLVAVVDVSRERLVHAADAQGRRIEAAIEGGAEARLAKVADLLAQASNARPADSHLKRIGVDIAAARDRLRAFAGGVYPAMLRSDGLGRAVGDLARRSPVPVTVRESAATRYDSAIESTLYFVCSEALANVAKHAGAGHVWIELDERNAGAFVQIDDDGVGGANLAQGSGLRGLADRVEALGGRLLVGLRPGGGSSVTATVPRRRAGSRPAEAIP
jgi:hypothetical protein